MALKSALTIINKNDQIKKLLNLENKVENLEAGKAKSYVVSGGGVGRSPDSIMPVWNHPQVQLSFSIYGSGGEALVTVVYSKRGYKSEVDYVGIDWVSDPNFFSDLQPPLVLYGDSSKFTVKGIMKNHASVLARS